MSHLRVLVLGGYGFFGRRLVERLSRLPSLHIQVAGRSQQAARAVVQAVEQTSASRLEAVTLDSAAPRLEEELRSLAPALMVNASGPFQGADYCIPRACIRAGINYVDLADGRAYVA